MANLETIDLSAELTKLAKDGILKFKTFHGGEVLEFKGVLVEKFETLVIYLEKA